MDEGKVNNPGAPEQAPQVDFAASPRPLAQDFDPFAEQNAKRAKEKTERKKLIRLAVIIGIIAAIIIVPLVVWLVLNRKDDEVPVVYFDSGSVEENLEKLSNYANQAYKPTIQQGENGQETVSGDREAAEKVFEETLAAPANRDYKNQILLEQILFYRDKGWYEELIKLAEKMEIDKLDDKEKIEFYNSVAVAYYYLGDMDKYNEYMEKTWSMPVDGQPMGG